jgi:anaerobic selenocysteine-containing dehydrogenase
VLSTRRGKQFNTMVHQARDPLTGALRDALFMAPADIESLGLRDGDAVVVRSEHGEMRAHLHASPMQPGNVQVFFPEGNVLLRMGRRDPASGVPDYNAVVTVEPAR